MKINKNQFKHALKNGHTQYGLWLGLADTISTEICACAGFHWLCIDAEHGPNDLGKVLAQLQAIQPYDSHAVVRPVDGNPSLIKQYLDVGAQTLLIPMIETRQQAENVVSAVRYPPRGIRGVGTALARASRWNLVEDYLAIADDEICLLIQVESQRALDNLSDILSVDGIHGVFVGPSDLAGSLGHLGNAGHPTVRNAVELAIKTIANSDKAPGVMTTDPELIKHYKNCGATFIGVGIDTNLLAKNAKHLADSLLTSS